MCHERRRRGDLVSQNHKDEMRELILKREYDQYTLYELDKIHLSVVSKRNPFVEKLFFYSEDVLLASFKKKYVFFFLFKREIIFQGNISGVVEERTKFSKLTLLKDEYVIRQGGNKECDSLWKNDEKIGEIKSVTNGISSYTKSIFCTNLDDCLIFAVLAVIIFDFDV